MNAGICVPDNVIMYNAIIREYICVLDNVILIEYLSFFASSHMFCFFLIPNA